MKPQGSRWAVAVGCALVVAGLSARAFAADPAAPTCIGVGPGSTLWIEGTSNVHDFESRTTSLRVTFICESGRPAPATAADLEALVRASGVRTVTVQVPVTTLHSGKSGLDKNLWQDLRADQHPSVEVELSHATLTAGADDTTEIHADGVLRIAGQERPATLVARVHRTADGLWLDGSQRLKMTDFGIKPRTMMLGTLRVHDQVTVRYHVLLVPAGTATGTHTAQ